MDRSKLSIKNICFVRTGGPGDAGAFERALRLSERTQAKLSVVGVIDPPPAGVVRLLASFGSSSEVIAGEADVSVQVERLADAARQRGVNAAAELLRGAAFFEVTRKVLRDGHDLVIKAAQPSQAIQRVLFGHTDRQLIRKCPCAVWIEKPSNGKTYDRILAAVDPAPYPDDPDVNPEREALNTSILQYGQLLAQLEDAELNIIHAWSFGFESALRSRAGLSDEEIQEVGQSLRQQHELALRELLEPYGREISRIHFVKGRAGEEIARLAARESIDVIVMGTLCRTGLGGLLIGNTAETILDHANCSILALKPQGFVSPVQT